MNSDTKTGGDEDRATPTGGVGAQLRAAREAMRVDLSHIAAQTRIPLRHLEAIERGDFTSLPSRTYAVGFSRSFASAVGLDPAAITDAVRVELSDTSMRRTVPSPGMEPGDPARLPSAGLAWFGAIAALVLAVGVYAFYNAYFGAGTQPGSLLTPAPAATKAPAAAASPTPAAPAPGGEVVLTAVEDGVWLRLYEEGGERLFERTLAKGETVIVPTSASDPRINTGRPDALAITVGKKPVARLAERPVTLSGVPVSAAALLARASPAAASAANTPASSAEPVPAIRRDPIPRPAQRRNAAPPAETVAEPAPAEPAPAVDASASDVAPGA
jgi:cytoskeletal protein RodZ